MMEMKPVSEMAAEKRFEPLVIAALTLLALVLRLIALLYWTDAPGDGPIRAMLAYRWWMSHSIPTHGGWPPGFKLLTGAFYPVVHDPVVSTRILNVILGTATVPVFYLFVRRVYNGMVALFSALLLAVFPLHIALSATSLSEPSALFEIVLGALLVMIAAETTRRQWLYLTLSLASLCLATMTRYEVWLLIPFFPAYYIWKTRQTFVGGVMMAVLLAFPAAWTVGNYSFGGAGYMLHLGMAAIGDAPHPSIQAHPRDFVHAVGTLGRRAVTNLGIVAVAVSWGAALQLLRAAKGKLESESALYLSMATVPWLAMLVVAVARPNWDGDRFLLLNFVLALPLALLPFEPWYHTHRRVFNTILVVSVLSVAVANVHYVPFASFVTQKRPTDMLRTGSWLRQSAYRDDAVLLTEMHWESTYFRVYFPEFDARTLTVDSWTPDSAVPAFLAERRPAVLITGDDDEASFTRVRALLGTEAHVGHVVHSEGKVKVYLLTLSPPELFGK